MVSPNTNFDSLLTTTLAKYRSRLTDNIFLDRPLTQWLFAKDRIRFDDGGVKIVEPLIYGSNDTVQTYSGYDPIALTPQEGISAAEFDWKQLAGSVAINGLEEAKNSGEAAMLKLLDARVMQLEESLKDKFSAMFFAATPGTNDFNSLPKLISDTGIAGNIDATSTNTWWRSYVKSAAEALSIGGGTAGNSMTSAYNTASNGNDHPDLGITTQLLFEKYESLLPASVRYTDTTTANAGFQNLLFKQMPVVFDTSCNAGEFYMLNSKYIQLVGMSGKWMEQTPFMRPENMDAKYSLILSYGNLTIRNRKRHAKLTAKTA